MIILTSLSLNLYLSLSNYRACCTDIFCGVCLPTDTDDECCVLATVASKQVMPTTCIKINGQCLCCDSRYVCPAEKKDAVAEEEIPCVCALGGMYTPISLSLYLSIYLSIYVLSVFHQYLLIFCSLFSTINTNTNPTTNPTTRYHMLC